jgi:hypothetical protein
MVCYQTSISFWYGKKINLQAGNRFLLSALFILYSPYLSCDEPCFRGKALSTFNNAADVALKVVERYNAGETIDPVYGDIPFFMLPWLYLGSVHFI